MPAPIIVQLVVRADEAQLLIAGDVARLLGCSLQHVLNLVDAGKLPAFNFSSGQSKERRCLRIPPAGLEKFLNGAIVV